MAVSISQFQFWTLTSQITVLPLAPSTSPYTTFTTPAAMACTVGIVIGVLETGGATVAAGVGIVDGVNAAMVRRGRVAVPMGGEGFG